jgi:hypothetical protein
MWMAHEELRFGLPTLVICRDVDEIGQCCRWFLESDIDHLVFYPEGDEKIEQGN